MKNWHAKCYVTQIRGRWGFIEEHIKALTFLLTIIGAILFPIFCVYTNQTWALTWGVWGTVFWGALIGGVGGAIVLLFLVMDDDLSSKYEAF